MKKICSLLVIASYLLIGCDKDNQPNNPDYVEVTVKLVDAVCNSAVFEIQEPWLKHHGESGFEYNGKIYDGVFYTTITCTNTNLLYRPPNNLPTVYTVKISKKPPMEQSCSPVFCQALPYKLPEMFYYVYNTGTIL